MKFVDLTNYSKIVFEYSVKWAYSNASGSPACWSHGNITVTVPYTRSYSISSITGNRAIGFECTSSNVLVKSIRLE